MKIKIKSAFTLIETLVVIGVLSLVLPTLFAIFYLILREQLRLYALTEVKRQGDITNTIMETVIRDYAVKIKDSPGSSGNQICSTSLNSQPSGANNFQDKFGNDFRFDVAGTQIASYSALLKNNPSYLTNNKVLVTAFNIGCNYTSTFSPPMVSINFTICYNNNGSCATNQEEAVSLNYSTFITLRNLPSK